MKTKHFLKQNRSFPFRTKIVVLIIDFDSIEGSNEMYPKPAVN